MLETRIPARTTQFIENFQNNEADSGNSRKASLVAIAASLLIGILVGVFAHSQLNVTEPEAQAPDWISQVANYQQLYIRPTVENAAPVNVEFLDKLFTDNLALEVKVPDLSNRSIEFMRGQLLEVNGNPLVQLAYLPAEGKPLAICIMRGQRAAGTPTSTIDQFGKSHGLTYGSWSQHGLNFVLVADMPIGDVKELVSQTRQQLESKLIRILYPANDQSR